MRRSLIIPLICLLTYICTSPIQAQFVAPREGVEPTELIATDAALEASNEATAAAVVVEERTPEPPAPNLTESSGAVKDRLAQLLDDNPIGQFTIFNFLQHWIRQAVNQGVPPNMLVLMLLFPVVVSLIAASRHIIGLEGFGVYGPAVLAVTFVSTGIISGIFLFLIIVITALIGRTFFHRFKLQYLPRTALLVWFVSIAIFFALLFSPYFANFMNLAAVGIFPILVLILLSENFIGSQISLNSSRLAQLTFETILLAASAAWVMGLDIVQNVVILHPELTIAMVALFDIAVGKYTGLRVTEYFRFKPILDQEE